MKKHLFLLPLLLLLPFCAWAQEEWVIEMQGDPAIDSISSVFEKNAKELSRKMRGKTRENLLYSMPIVSNKDRIVNGAGAEYALVEYYEGDQFRKFLFHAETPQTFITAAATAADVLAVNKKYGINIGLTQADFESFYKEKAQIQKNDLLPTGSALYKLAYKDVNTPKAKNRWFLFENKTLSKTFENAAEKNAYLDSLKPKETIANQPAKQAKPQPRKQTRPVRKALISGGTATDRAYMPRVVNPKPMLPTPKLSTATNPKKSR
ncbi:hypothetical protein [Candidatus Avelusimicrobium sp.]